MLRFIPASFPVKILNPLRRNSASPISEVLESSLLEASAGAGPWKAASLSPGGSGDFSPGCREGGCPLRAICGCVNYSR